MGELFKRLSAKDGGFTYQPMTGKEPTRGFALSTYPQRSWAKPASELKLTDLVAYAKNNADLFARSNHFLGAWHDPETDQVFLDISVLTEDRKKAERLAHKYDQIAYFDIGEGKSVTVNRDAKSGGAVKGEEHGNETTYDARATWIESFLGGIGSAIQKAHGARTDSRGNRGSSQTNDLSGPKVGLFSSMFQ